MFHRKMCGILLILSANFGYEFKYLLERISALRKEIDNIIDHKLCIYFRKEEVDMYDMWKAMKPIMNVVVFVHKPDGIWNTAS